MEGFLPRNAIIMARKAKAPAPMPARQEPVAEPAAANSAETVDSENPNAQIVFVGEGPFSGEAGQLLDKMIVAMGLSREQVHLADVKDPESLTRQLDLMKPKVVVALGELAVQTLLGAGETVAKIRGTFRPFRGGAKLMPTFHPGDLLRNPASKREAWEDLKSVAKELGIALPAGKKS